MRLSGCPDIPLPSLHFNSAYVPLEEVPHQVASSFMLTQVSHRLLRQYLAPGYMCTWGNKACVSMGVNLI